METERPDDGDSEGEPGKVVPVSDFEAVQEHLAAWCATGNGGEFSVETENGVERAVCEFGSAEFAVTADGRVDGGMPLHGFSGQAERLVFEEGSDAVRVLGPDVEYVYRRP